MGQVLRGGAVGPVGDWVGAGEPPAKDWPAWFLADLAEHGHLTDEPVQKAAPSGHEPVTLTARGSRKRKQAG